jgi:hypothetical protein
MTITSDCLSPEGRQAATTGAAAIAVGAPHTAGQSVSVMVSGSAVRVVMSREGSDTIVDLTMRIEEWHAALRNALGAR